MSKPGTAHRHTGANFPVPTETELKLRIAPEAAAKLSRHPALAKLKRGRPRTSRLLSTYFDTNGGDLAAAGIALRVRRDRGRWIQTVKGPPSESRGGSMTTRVEFEWPVAGLKLDPLRFAITPFRRALGKAEKLGLTPQFTTDIARTVIPLAFADSTMALLCVDAGEARIDDGAGRCVPIHEIELELEVGDVARLFELAHLLAADVPLAIETASKAERGYALRHGRAATPAHAVDADLPAGIAAGAAFAAIIRGCLAQIEANADGVMTDDDPEWVHQMRIGVRRLRACLSLARHGFATARVEPVRVELRWLAHALGPARDFDVFSTQTLPTFVEAMRRDSGATALKSALGQLATRATARRNATHIVARAAVASKRFVRLALAAAALAASPGTAGRETLDQPAAKFARPLLKRRHRALLALGDDLAHAAPEARHAARLAAKKLRYAAEFFAPLFPRKRARNYRRALAALQEELGVWNDTAVAARIASEQAGADSAAAGAFSGWAAAQGVARGAALTKAWSAFVGVRPFWTRE